MKLKYILKENDRNRYKLNGVLTKDKHKIAFTETLKNLAFLINSYESDMDSITYDRDTETYSVDKYNEYEAEDELKVLQEAFKLLKSSRFAEIFNVNI